MPIVKEPTDPDEAVIAPVTDPVAPIQAPFLAKHPSVILIPFEPVGVAVRSKRVKEMPPVKVEVAALVCQKVPVVNRVVEALAKYEVEEAMRPFLNHAGDVVEMTFVPKFEPLAKLHDVENEVDALAANAVITLLFALKSVGNALCKSDALRSVSDTEPATGDGADRERTIPISAMMTKSNKMVK